MIGEQTGIERSPTQVRQFLRHLGLTRQKVGMIPAKADPDQQAQFHQQELQPRLEQAQAGERAVFFMDAAHACVGPVSGLSLVAGADLHPRPQWSPAIQCVGRAQRHHPPTDHGDQPHLYHCHAGL